MRPTTLIEEMRAYHRQHAQLLGRVARGDFDAVETPRLLAKIVLEMVRHTVDEEVFLVPEVRRRLGEEEAGLCGRELARLDELVRVLERTEVGDPALAAVLGELGRAYAVHARRQETGVFRALEQRAPGGELEDLGRVAAPTVESGPTASHPVGLRLSGSLGWPAPGLADRVRDRLVADAVARRNG